MAANEVVSLTAETEAAPQTRTSNYMQVSEPAEQVGGGLVYLSRNRKSVAKRAAGDPQPPVYVTSDVAGMQQSIPYRAIGTALVHDVVSLAQVLSLYAKHGRIGAVVDLLVSDHAEEFTSALLGSHEDYVLGLTEDEDEDEDATEVPADGTEVTEEEAAL